MQQLLDQITEHLGPQLAGPLAERFGLSSDQASEAVPAVARPLLDNLRQKAEAPAQNLGLLSTLQDFLTDDSKPTDPANASAARPGDPTADLVEKLSDGGLSGMAGTVAQTLGINAGKAQPLLLFVAPKIFALLRSRAQSGGLEAVLRPLLGGNANVGELLQLVQGAGGLGGAAKSVGGMLGS